MAQTDPVVIVGAARTPMGGMLGDFAGVPATRLGGVAIKAALERSKVDPADIGEVLMGCCLMAGLKQAPARQAAHFAGVPWEAGATTLTKMCGSAMKTTMIGHDNILAGSHDVVITGGMESMTNAPYLVLKGRTGYRLGHGDRLMDHMFYDGLEDAYEEGRSMGTFAEECAQMYQFTREAQDAFAAESVTRAQRASNEGIFDEEIAPVTLKDRKGEKVIAKDQAPFQVNIAKIPTLKPAFRKDGTVTAATSSSISDGAAALVLMRRSNAEKKGITPLAVIHSHATNAQAPNLFTTAPVGALLAKRWHVLFSAGLFAMGLFATVSRLLTAQPQATRVMQTLIVVAAIPLADGLLRLIVRHLIVPAEETPAELEQYDTTYAPVILRNLRIVLVVGGALVLGRIWNIHIDELAAGSLGSRAADALFTIVVALLLASAPALAQEDYEGCKDHPLFTRFPNTYIVDCASSQFDLRKFPVGQVKPGEEVLRSVEVEGPTWRVSFQIKEGTTPPSGLQLMRNFEAAAKKAGGTIEGQWPGWCKANYDSEGMPDMGNSCTSFGMTMKFVKGGKETWAFFQASESDGSYLMTVSEREAMKQEVAVHEIADQLKKDGFVSLYVTFDTGEATISPDSAKLLDDAAAALKAVPEMKIEVGGHTDNVGSADANLKLSRERAQAVMAALAERGVAAGRLTAKGYGQTVPVADNRTEDGRAKNRRVELVKK